ncbi:hypothetical protein [Legionella spiritensis]|uniref:Guanylate cyclase n=1 Tax=Legionella spiritensis TaxID=452 RepID=A0A0W0Z8Q2_LEGSP|nr:hypothetical protein [Legionella spiritensis]KTD65496.1 guanylate cyclase [Legionella spiritensis]SNV35929.1 guanylate cyclase [Legionella spiritensis]
MAHRFFKDGINLVNRIIAFWLFLLFLSIASLVFLIILANKIDAERLAQKDKAELIQLASELRRYSNFLTAQTRSFVVTSDVEYLQNYWDEVLIYKNRENILARLKTIPGVTGKDLHLLTIAKKHSDDLIQTELRAMKLVLSAYQVPQELYLQSIKNYHLTPTDMALSPPDKLALAQEIMFNKSYSTMKAKIMEPIDQFIRNVLAISIMTSKHIQKNTDLLFLIFSSLIISIIASIIAIVWLRILLISKVPEKGKSGKKPDTKKSAKTTG